MPARPSELDPYITPSSRSQIPENTLWTVDARSYTVYYHCNFHDAIRSGFDFRYDYDFFSLEKGAERYPVRR